MVYVFFATGHPWHFPDAVTRYLSRSHFAHVMVGDPRGVFDPVGELEEIRPFEKTWIKYPTLQTMLAVPCQSPIDPTKWPLLSYRRRFAPSLFRFVFRLRSLRVTDCVQRVAAYLRACGIDVPPIYHAWELYAYLKPLAAREHVADSFHRVLTAERRRLLGVAPETVSDGGTQSRHAQRPARITHPGRKVPRG